MARPKKKARKRPKYTRGLTQAERRQNLEAKVLRFLFYVCVQGLTLQQIADKEKCTRAYVYKIVKDEPKYIQTMQNRPNSRKAVSANNGSISKEERKRMEEERKRLKLERIETERRAELERVEKERYLELNKVEIERVRNELIPIYFGQRYSDESISEALEMTVEEVDKWLKMNGYRERKTGRIPDAKKGIVTKTPQKWLLRLAEKRRKAKSVY